MIHSESIGIKAGEYAARRGKVLKALKGSVGVVFAGSGDAHLDRTFWPDWNFFYLTGIATEPGAAVLFDPTNENPRRRISLFLTPRDPEMEVWDGYRDPIGEAMRAQLGFESVFRTRALPMVLSAAARRAKSLACLHPFSGYTSDVSPDLGVFRRIIERTIGVTVEDRTKLLPDMRGVKSANERKLMQGAITATAAGFNAALKAIRPGVSERDVQRAVERGFQDAGGEGPAYNSIVGSGLSSTVLHYMSNNGRVEDGDLVLIDAGARYAGYAADITRTFPANGKFSREQKDLYTLVLRAQDAAIGATRPGATITDVDRAARDIIEKAGMGDQYMHGIGHHLGLEVHDVNPEGPLKPGHVITIEPGVYLPDRKMGVRIEDDVLVTAKGSQNLSREIPKAVADIEAAMKRR